MVLVLCTLSDNVKIFVQIFAPPRWLVGCFGLNGPLGQYFSLYRAVCQREGKRKEMIDEKKNVQITPTHTYYKRSRPVPYSTPDK